MRLPRIPVYALALSAVVPLAAQSDVPIPRRLTLPQAESLLARKSLAVAVARHHLEAAEAARLIAACRPNPQVQLGAEQFPIKSPLSGTVPRLISTDSDAGAQPTYTFLLTQLIERGGKRELRTKQAEAQSGAARAQVADTLRQQTLQLRQAFAAAILARENLAIARQALEEYERTEKLTETRVDAGEAPRMELYRVHVSKLPYQQAVLQAQAAAAQASLDVLNLLGARREDVEQGAELEIVGEFSRPQPALTLDEIKRIGLRERPDIEMARRTAEAGQVGVRLAQAQRKRDITVGTEYQRVGSDSALGVTASFPLLIFNNQKAAISQAVALEHAAGTQLRQAEVQAVTDIEKAWQAYRAARQNAAVYSAANVEQAGKMRDVALFSYKQGATSLFELLDAQRTLHQARAGFHQARFDLENAVYQLEAAMGRDLEGARP